MSDFITGVVNEYYNSEEDAAAGMMPVWRDEVYARSCMDDPTKWDVRRLTVQPLMPRGIRLPHQVQNLFLIAAAQMSLPAQNEIVTIAHRVDVKTAFNMVRQHEIEPPAISTTGDTPRLYTLKQVREPEDGLTDWQHLKL